MVSQTFISGIPKGEYRIRLNTTEIPIDNELSDLLVNLKLTIVPQDDGYSLIHGRKDDVKAFLNELRRKAGEQKTV